MWFAWAVDLAVLADRPMDLRTLLGLQADVATLLGTDVDLVDLHAFAGLALRRDAGAAPSS